MRAYRVLPGAALAAASVCFAGQALAQAVPDDLARAALAWGVCRGHVVDQRFRGSESAAAIAEEALNACRADEAKVRALAEQHYGPATGSATVDQLIAAGRVRLMKEVDDRRSGNGFSEPNAAWGECIGHSVSAASAGADDPDAIVEKAFAACRDAEQKMHAADGDASAANVAQARALMRERALRMIADARRR